MAHKRLYEKIANAISEQIIRGDYEIDDRLPSERLLAEQHGVSRPTMREAMIALEVDGLVEVCTGSGVYVRSLARRHGKAAPMDIGPFELLEARARVEGEAAALAASVMTDEIITELEKLLDEMEEENGRDVVMSEDADRRFHLTIAAATKNSAMLHVVTELWDVRERSLQSVRFLEKSRAEGIKPRIDEHISILDALRNRDPNAARSAMRTHLQGVADMVFKATEAEALERARTEVAETRNKFQIGNTI